MIVTPDFVAARQPSLRKTEHDAEELRAARVYRDGFGLTTQICSIFGSITVQFVFGLDW
jgi:hypothetical protein